MKTIKTWLTTMAVLLCSITVNAVTYSDWTSTNKGQGNSTSSNSYSITASAGDVLTFEWEVSSESNYDKLIVTLDGTEILNKSGVLSGTYQHTFNSSGKYTMVVKYTKDDSLNKNGDYAKVYNMVLSETNSGNSDTNNVIASGTYVTNLTWKLTNKGELIIEGTGDIVNCPWSSYREDIKCVSISEGVSKIGSGAFSNCSNLTDVNIPNSVKEIANAAFRNCTSLVNINIPNTITSLPEVFRGCTSLKNIEIPNSVSSLSYTFYDCVFRSPKQPKLFRNNQI